MKTILAYLLFFSASLAWADEFSCPSPKPLKGGTLEGIERSYQKLSSLRAGFVQSSFFVGLDRRETSRGEVAFLKPGKMNWNYLEPDPQRFVSDGKTIWFYQPKLNQVTMTDFQESFSSDVPVTFLLGMGSLRASFEPVGGCSVDGGLLVELKPKRSDASLSNFFLLVDAQAFTPLGAKVVDIGGNETTIKLLAPQFDSNFSASQFLFEIPKGVDIIDNRGGNQRSSAPLGEENLVQ